jgi:hypothetical protein
VEFGNVAGRSPKDLAIQIKICMHDSVPHRNDLPPRYFGMALSQLNGETANSLTDHRQMMENAADKTSSLRNERSEVAATIASILWHAERMSFRNDGSCRIDDSGIFENLRTYPRLQSAPGNQVNPPPSEGRQLLDEGFELDQADAYSRLELYHDVDVAFWTHLAADRGPKKRQLLDTVTAAYLREQHECRRTRVSGSWVEFHYAPARHQT